MPKDVFDDSKKKNKEVSEVTPADGFLQNIPPPPILTSYRKVHWRETIFHVFPKTRGDRFSHS